MIDAFVVLFLASNTMGYQIVYEMNPFFLSFIFFILVFIFKQRLTRRSKSDHLGLVLRICVVVNLGLVFSFEFYFNYFKCAVSNRYYQTNLMLTHRMMSLMNRHNMSYWLDFATLLNQLRNENISPWDHDVDFSVVDPEYSDSLAHPHLLRTDPPSNPQRMTSKTRKLMDFFESQGLCATYNRDRHLIQLWTTKSDAKKEQGPHIDLWLWIPQIQDDQNLVLWTVDRDIRYNPRKISEIFPLRNVTWQDHLCFIPSHSHRISQQEYKVYPGHYLKARTGRTDCVHNLFYGRFMY